MNNKPRRSKITLAVSTALLTLTLSSNTAFAQNAPMPPAGGAPAGGAPAGGAPAAATGPWHSANCLAQELVELIARALHALPPSSPHGTLAPVLLRYRREVVAAQPGQGRARRRRGVLGTCCGAPAQ